MMHVRPCRLSALLVAFLLISSAAIGRADDGIWLFNAFPKEQVAGKYGVQVTVAFLDHLRLASVRVGASGSFVSSKGLLFTNHHVASECIQRLSSAEHDYMADGFYAVRVDQERKCPDLEATVLLSIEDVTAKVNTGVAAGTATAEANRIRKANSARIEKACAAAAGDLCEVVTLYSGGEYHLYRSRKYTDIRLVFAPEAGIAAFGGDPDNFTYPRFCLDITFLRAYEKGKPAETPVYLRWSREGVRDRELTFVSGHPGTTGRLDTMAQLEFFRDYSYPLVQGRLASLIQALQKYGARDTEARRVAADNLHTQQNSFKAYNGFLAGLRDPKFMEMKRAEERQLRVRLTADPKYRETAGNSWEEVADTYAKYRAFYKPYWLLETAATRGSEFLRIARDVARLAEERVKSDDQRLREYRDAAFPSLEDSLFAEVPISDSMEIAVLANYFEYLRQALGTDDPVVKRLLEGKAPAKAAAGYVGATRLRSVAERRRLSKSADAVRESADSMIRLARLLDEPARSYRKQYEDVVEATLRRSAARIAQARFALLGTGSYPDATFTLRLSYGPVKGYENAAGKEVPYATTFAGLYQRATGEEPFRLPERWVKAKASLNLNTPFNFVTTADTHGGNSGSPTVNTKGEIIGILFDGNIESLPNRFIYTEQTARSVHVASQGIFEALKAVYHADRLLGELTGREASAP